jgi:iron complex outermembrane receptor protein
MSVRAFKLKPSVVAVAATLVFPAFALAQSADAGNDKIQRVEITGSSIKRIEAETALPVQILRRADIERTGATSTEELVKQLSSLASSGSSTTSANASGFGGGSIATVSLRGLGSGRTLVLINGRRTSVYGGASGGAAGSSVDVNSIPLSAIERVEVLKDGASAVYGSDAIAGVVNFILRKDFSGIEVSATAGETTMHPRAADKRFSLFAGKGNLAKDGYNLTFGANLQSIDPIFGADRDYARRLNVAESNDLLSSITFPANVFIYGSKGVLAAPTLPNCGPLSQVSPYAPTRCSYDNSPYVSIQPASDKFNLMLNGRMTLGANAEGYFESSYSQTKTRSTTQHVPLAYNNSLVASNPYNPVFKNLIATQYPQLGTKPFSTTFGAAFPSVFLLPPSSPYYPAAFAAANGMAGMPLALSYRDEANGPRTTVDQADNARFMTGVRGTLGAWDYDTGLLYSQSKVKEDLVSGYPLYSKLLPVLDTGLINPFGPTADQSALAAAKAAEFVGTNYKTQTSTLSVDAKVSRELMTLAAGTVNLAMGAEARKEKFAYNPSSAIQTGDIVGIGGNQLPVSAERNVMGAFAEVNLPILKTLEADAAVRYDHYQNVGSTVNPKLSLRWQPNSTILLRSAVGTGFRAPSLTDLYTAQASSVTSNGTRDPLRCPDVKTGAPADCNNQFSTITGGNPDLKPEKSLSYTFGIVLEPIRDMSIAFDAFRVNLKNAIVGGGLSSTYILSNAARATQYSAYILRGAPDGNASGVGPITGILQTNANLFKTQLSGVDVDGKYALRLPSSRLTFRLSGTFLNKYDVQGPDGTYTSSLDRGLSAGGGVILRWKHNASLTYETGSWAGSLLQNYQKGYQDVLGSREPTGTTPRKVEAYQTFDAQLAYNGIASTKLAVGVKNLTNRNPPYTNLASNFLGGYDTNYGDVRGRYVYATATYSYK